MRGEDSARRARLTWFSMKTLSTHRVTKTFCRTRCCQPRKSGLKTKSKSGNSSNDKASCHTAKSTKRWLEQHGVGVVEAWPTKGDDINPMENLWAILDDKLEHKKFTTEEGMKKSTRELWDEVDSSLLHNLIHSIPDRLRRIRKAEGGSIKAVN